MCVNLAEFIASMHKDVESFKAMWESGAAESAEQFPNEMEEGDWFDQFMLFESGQE
jgi:hypothetical protein